VPWTPQFATKLTNGLSLDRHFLLHTKAELNFLTRSLSTKFFPGSRRKKTWPQRLLTLANQRNIKSPVPKRRLLSGSIYMCVTAP